MNGKYWVNTHDCHFTNMAIYLLHNKIEISCIIYTTNYFTFWQVYK